ncbi:MAG: hypothetical protein RL685_5810 [Pseudomonadota bacterium]|jgi:hypothetical protein
MDDRQSGEARTPRESRFVTERQLRTALDESLWQVERLRVDVTPSQEPGGGTEAKASSAGVPAARGGWRA